MNTKMKVQFVDLRQQYLSLKEEIDSAINNVLDTTHFILGENVRAFEEEFASYCGTKYCVGVASGTDALLLSLRAVGIKAGDEVVTTPRTFVATIDAIARNGAIPKFYETNNKTKAIVPVHLYGEIVGNIRETAQLAKEQNIKLVEDACQAHGAKLGDRKAGSFGDVGCFSFYPAKNLGCYGDGGAMVTNNEEIAEKVRMLRDYGQKEKYHHDLIGFNSRLDEIQAAVLRVKLKYLDGWNEQRYLNAMTYNDLLRDVSSLVETPKSFPDTHVFHIYAIRCKRRDELQKFLYDKGVCTGIHYPIPIHLQKAYSYLGYKEGSFPEVEQRAKEILSLPMFPELEEGQIRYVCDKIEEFYGVR